MYDMEKTASEKFKYNGFYNKHFDVLSGKFLSNFYNFILSDFRS